MADFFTRRHFLFNRATFTEPMPPLSLALQSRIGFIHIETPSFCSWVKEVMVIWYNEVMPYPTDVLNRYRKNAQEGVALAA